MIAAWTRGSRERITHLLRENYVPVEPVESWADALRQPPKTPAIITLGLERGFVAGDIAVIGEQDLLGERISRPPRRRKRADQFIAEATEIAEGDLVVHQEYGIGRYDGLETLRVGPAPHDCLRLIYDGNEKLYLPVENIELLSRFGEGNGVALDKLGGAGWQTRKARMKQRIRDMAGELIRVAAARRVREAPLLAPPDGEWQEFVARFPFAETEDQMRAISDVLEDLASGRPMDRLVCGDVGFGKTEVALRAAFVAAMSGAQVAVVVPTTLLARQHTRTFAARFAGLPIKIAQLSRMVTAKEAAETKRGLADGTVNIVIGTHAILAKGIEFAGLELLIVDEEQHFGVSHKEKLKALKADVHVLTLTATPIPRTLQLALTGVREMSLIATPPVDRLAVRTFISPFDSVVIREAIQRERFRGGQVFCVVPRIEDMDRMAERLRAIVPEARMVQAHGRLAPTELERVMTEFSDGKFDILLSTNIVESGLDIPSVNTLIIYRADMFGLGQLYQLRGRVGRGKQRGYAYLTWPTNHRLSAAAEKRLDVMQTLDQLGAGFTLASHDLDIRGAGNLLGDEQSGHIREVGIELYQQMLEDAVVEMRAEKGRKKADDRDWTPNIQLGLPVLIPDTYVADLPVRLGLYRRIGTLASDAESEAMAAELVDRFGKLPPEVENLLQVVDAEAHVPRGRRREAGGRAEGHGAAVPRQRVPQPGRPDRLARPLQAPDQAAPGPQARAGARHGRGRPHEARPRRAGQPQPPRRRGAKPPEDHALAEDATTPRVPRRPASAGTSAQTLRIGLPLAAAQLARWPWVSPTPPSSARSVRTRSRPAASAASIEISTLVILQGVLAALSALVAQARGAGRGDDSRPILDRPAAGRPADGPGTSCCSSNAERLLLAVGEPAELPHATGRFLWLAPMVHPRRDDRHRAAARVPAGDRCRLDHLPRHPGRHAAECRALLRADLRHCRACPRWASSARRSRRRSSRPRPPSRSRSSPIPARAGASSRWTRPHLGSCGRCCGSACRSAPPSRSRPHCFWPSRC